MPGEGGRNKKERTNLMKIADNILETIGHTPLVKINRMNDGSAEIVVKLEKQNPAGSVKDRPALNMIEKAEKEGLINKNTVIIEPTSGNTGIGLALVCPANPEAHSVTADEIWDDTDGKVDIVVAGVGTGGTICGLSKFLKEKNSNIKAIAVEPYENQVLKGEKAGAHKIQGIGANFVPENFDKTLVDEIIPVKSDDAILTARLMAKEEGILSGISSGAAQRRKISFKRVVLINFQNRAKVRQSFPSGMNDL